MADATLSTDISGENGLTAGVAADFDADNTFLPADNTNGETVNITPRQITDAVGDTTFAGAATGAGKVGATITLTLPANSIALAKLAAQTPNSFIGFDASGVPFVGTFGSGLTFVGGILSASAPATADPYTRAIIRHYARGL